MTNINYYAAYGQRSVWDQYILVVISCIEFVYCMSVNFVSDHKLCCNCNNSYLVVGLLYKQVMGWFCFICGLLDRTFFAWLCVMLMVYVLQRLLRFFVLALPVLCTF